MHAPFLAVLAVLGSILTLCSARAADRNAPSGPIDVGSRRELFIDGFVIGELKNARLQLHHPAPQEVALVNDRPWEGSDTASYCTVFQDGDLYRMYYIAHQLEPFFESKRGPLNSVSIEERDRAYREYEMKTFKPGEKIIRVHPMFYCYAESNDGINWRKPELGLFEFEGSKVNNIVMPSGMLAGMNVQAGTMAVFKDENPNARPDARYKGFVRSLVPNGLVALKSADGLRWSVMADQPVVTDGMFDSQNLAFWDGAHGVYRAYWRYRYEHPSEKTPDGKPRQLRDIRTATSTDFIHWSAPNNVNYGNAPYEQLYTNQIKPYFRAPHVLIGFPARYIDRGWSDSMRELPDPAHREWRAGPNRRYGTALTDSLLMTSRDGVNFKRWDEAFLRPGIERDGTWNYGQQYIAWHVVETKSALPGAPNELSFYASENRWIGPHSLTRRYTLRLDGFVSVQAPRAGGEVLTKPLRFNGAQLALNFATSAAGSVRVELQDVNGVALPGFSLADCPPIFGDSVERIVRWTRGRDVSSLGNEPVRLRFVLADADLYAFQFVTP